MSIEWYPHCHGLAISVVEATWGTGKFVQDKGEDPGYVIAATHASVLSTTCHIKELEMDLKSPSLENPSFSPPTHIGFTGMALVLNSGARPQTPIVPTPIVSPKWLGYHNSISHSRASLIFY